MCFQAKLRVRDPVKREKRVNIVLSQLGLMKCQHTRIGVMGIQKGISGKNYCIPTFKNTLSNSLTVTFLSLTYLFQGEKPGA